MIEATGHQVFRHMSSTGVVSHREVITACNVMYIQELFGTLYVRGMCMHVFMGLPLPCMRVAYMAEMIVHYGDLPGTRYLIWAAGCCFAVVRVDFSSTIIRVLLLCILRLFWIVFLSSVWYMRFEGLCVCACLVYLVCTYPVSVCDTLHVSR